MFPIDIPYEPVQATPIVLVQASASSSALPLDSTQQADYLVKMCDEKSSAEEKNTSNFVTPAEMVIVQIGNKEHRYIDRSTAISQTTLIKTTEHGKLVQETTKNGKVFFTYEPELDYVGKDKATFMVEYAGKRYKVILTLEVSTLVDNNTPLCPEPQFIKVTKPSSGFNGYNLNYVLSSYRIKGVSIK